MPQWYVYRDETSQYTYTFELPDAEPNSRQWLIGQLWLAFARITHEHPSMAELPLVLRNTLSSFFDSISVSRTITLLQQAMAHMHMDELEALLATVTEVTDQYPAVKLIDRGS